MTPGKKATEFWAMVMIGVLILANGFTVIDIPWEQIQWYGGIVAAYIGGRSWVKANAAKPAPVLPGPAPALPVAERRDPIS